MFSMEAPSETLIAYGDAVGNFAIEVIVKSLSMMDVIVSGGIQLLLTGCYGRRHSQR